MATTPRKPPSHRSKSTAPLAGIKKAIKEKEILKEKPAEAAPVVAPAPIVQEQKPIEYVKKVDERGRAYATGKRKNAIARVWLKPGSGKIIVNGRECAVYFARPVLQMVVNQPFGVANRAGQFDVECLVTGGGLSGQAGAVKHGISKALTYFEPELRGALKKALFLRRDPRIVERKKYGHVKARKRFQYSKR